MTDRLVGGKNSAEDPQAEAIERSKSIARQIVGKCLPAGEYGDIAVRAARFRLALLWEKDRLLIDSMIAGGGEVGEPFAGTVDLVTFGLCSQVINEDLEKARLELSLHARYSYDGKRIGITISQLQEKAAVVAEAARPNV